MVVLKKAIFFFVGRMRSSFKHPVYLFICVCAYLIIKSLIHRRVCFTGAVMENLAKDLLGVNMCSFLPKHNRNLSNEFRCFVNYPSRLLSGWGAEASAGRRRPHRQFPAERSTQVVLWCWWRVRRRVKKRDFLSPDEKKHSTKMAGKKTRKIFFGYFMLTRCAELFICGTPEETMP